MPPLVLFVLFCFGAYLAGSVNFSLLIFRWTGRDDPRRHGSRNPGTTNVYRQAGPAWAVLVLLLDVARAAAVALVAQAWLAPWQMPWAGLAVVLGNRFPCFHGFRGGKGVANYLGFTLGTAPGWAALGALTWVGAQSIWRTAFLSSFCMVFFLSVGLVSALELTGRDSLGVWAVTGLIVSSHHANLRQWWGQKRAKR